SSEEIAHVAATKLAQDFPEVAGIHSFKMEFPTRSATSPAKSLTSRPARSTSPAERTIWLAVAKAIVLAALFLITQNVVGILNFLEFCLRLLVAWVAIGVKLPRQLAISLLDLLRRGVTLDPQNFVVITRHDYPRPARVRVDQVYFSACQSRGKGTG